MNQVINNALVVIRSEVDWAFQRLELYGPFRILAVPRNEDIGTISTRFLSKGTTAVWVDGRRIMLSNDGKVVDGRVKSYQIMM